MRLPPELLDKIFALASADGGKTTCALRATSQTFRAMNEPYYLNTVFVTSVDSIWALCDTLRSIPIEQRRVRTLHIRVEPTRTKPAKSKHRKRWFRHLLPGATGGNDSEVRCKPPSASELALHAVMSLCRLCTTTLSTLALMVHDNIGRLFYSSIFYGSTYPLLHTLVIGNVQDSGMLSPNSVAYTMPRLERLYLGGCHDISAWAEIVWQRSILQFECSVQYIYVQFKPGRDAIIAACVCLTEEPNFDFVVPEFPPSKPQVLHLWPVDDNNIEEWEGLMDVRAHIPMARKRNKVQSSKSSFHGLMLTNWSTDGAGPARKFTNVW
jgi:hypothetical protein